MRELVSDQWPISEWVGSDTGSHHGDHSGGAQKAKLLSSDLIILAVGNSQLRHISPVKRPKNKTWSTLRSLSLVCGEEDMLRRTPIQDFRSGRPSSGHSKAYNRPRDISHIHVCMSGMP